VFRFDELLAEIAGSLSSLSEEQNFRDCSADNTTLDGSTVSFHQTTNSSRFAVSDPHQSPSSQPWYNIMLANKVDRRKYDERRTKNGREMIPLATIADRQENVDSIKTMSNSTSEDHRAALKRDFAETVAEVKLILVVLDVLLVLHRLTTLRFDMSSLSRRHSRRVMEATPAVVRSPKAEADMTVKSATELAFDEYKEKVSDLKTGSRHSERETLVVSQSERSSSSRDHRTCSRDEAVDLNHCVVVVVVCVGLSMMTLLPVALVGGPSRAGVVLSRVVLPTLQGTAIAATATSSTGQRPHISGQRSVISWSGWSVVDRVTMASSTGQRPHGQLSSADIQQQFADFELRQLLSLRKHHGNNMMKLENVAIANALPLEAARATPVLYRFNYDAMPLPSLMSLNLTIAVL